MIVNAYDVAVSLANTRFKGATWGEVNCTEFVEAVLTEQIRAAMSDPTFRLPVAVMRRLHVSDVSPADLPAMILSGCVRAGGVASAIVIGSWGWWVAPANAQRSDYAQWWRRGFDGKWEGHAFIVEDAEVAKSAGGVVTCRAYGAHRSLNGIGTHPKRFALSGGPDRRVYLARVKPGG